jgi:hypothetical protein
VYWFISWFGLIVSLQMTVCNKSIENTKETDGEVLLWVQSKCTHITPQRIREMTMYRREKYESSEFRRVYRI